MQCRAWLLSRQINRVIRIHTFASLGQCLPSKFYITFNDGPLESLELGRHLIRIRSRTFALCQRLPTWVPAVQILGIRIRRFGRCGSRPPRRSTPRQRQDHQDHNPHYFSPSPIGSLTTQMISPDRTHQPPIIDFPGRDVSLPQPMLGVHTFIVRLLSKLKLVDGIVGSGSMTPPSRYDTLILLPLPASPIPASALKSGETASSRGRLIRRGLSLTTSRSPAPIPPLAPAIPAELLYHLMPHPLGNLLIRHPGTKKNSAPGRMETCPVCVPPVAFPKPPPLRSPYVSIPAPLFCPLARQPIRNK